MSSIILLESPDNCGKSTQIHEINRHFYPDKLFHTLHYGGVRKPGITPDQYKEISKKYYREMFSLFQIAQYNNLNLICDRSHIGDFIYGPLFRNYDGSYVFDLEKETSLNWKEIYLITFIDEVDNLIKREDGYSYSIDREVKQKEINLFIEAHETSTIPHKFLLNIKDYGIKEVGEIVCSWLDKEMK